MFLLIKKKTARSRKTFGKPKDRAGRFPNESESHREKCSGY